VAQAALPERACLGGHRRRPACGVLAAREVDTAARRLRTVESIAGIEVLPIDEAAHGLPVVTPDDDDFDALDGLTGVRVVKV
jgi:hypothetical protein